ncbi:MAG: hypothetical protein CTY12_06315 [Methylotenera sp.]|nr:MAG: hypothetical protein CTY12_06315 [Methylotenera sp.]
MTATTEELPPTLTYYGTAATIEEAVNQLIIKLLEDPTWRLLLPPFPIYKHDGLDNGGALVSMTGIGFLLHKFPVLCTIIPQDPKQEQPDQPQD